MKKIKKLMFVFVAMFTFSTVSYALETSIGLSWGIGGTVNRGEASDDFNAIMEGLGLNSSGLPLVLVPQVNVMLEFTPFLALETGVEVNFSVAYTYATDSDENTLFPFLSRKTIGFHRYAVGVPIMVRGQYEWSRVLVYGSVGPKIFGIVSGNYATGDEEFKDYLDMFEDRYFSIDMAFALGVEFRLGDANYLGLRGNYNVNVLAPATFNGKDLYHDNWNVGITYRYAFNSKWKK